MGRTPRAARAALEALLVGGSSPVRLASQWAARWSLDIGKALWRSGRRKSLWGRFIVGTRAPYEAAVGGHQTAPQCAARKLSAVSFRQSALKSVAPANVQTPVAGQGAGRGRERSPHIYAHSHEGVRSW